MRLPRPGVLPVAAALLTAAVTLDVLAGGPLRALDHRVFADGLPPRTGAWHWTWRTIVNAGQYWLVGALVAGTAAAVAWRHRRIRPLLVAVLWLAATEASVRGAQLAFARTPPRTGHDTLAAAGYLSYPSGHAANAAACLLFAAALARASRRATIAAHVLAAAVAAGVVALGYHWPTDAAAGWGVGVLLACAGRALLTRPEPAAPRSPPAAPPAPPDGRTSASARSAAPGRSSPGPPSPRTPDRPSPPSAARPPP